MRARMALKQAHIVCEIIDISFKDKPQEMLDISPKGTVPVLKLNNNTVIDESLDIMYWALRQNDHENWLGFDISLIQDNDLWFKKALDRYKYPNRFPDQDCSGAQADVLNFFNMLNDRLCNTLFLSADHSTLSDIAIFPFIRQASHVNRPWFESLPLTALQKWLDYHLHSALFLHIFDKNIKKM